ncbi:hypothetical protein EV421DRAFT_1985970 [Armillaria borealis]|uniref:Uncharacterized protein n=1 Tax=Armillaria borealis TaxID=47425 RepID=A0AA39ID83_9AGAR|nr:hypothetical protein EV421DRAFT_1985970 [Armillaria borealis]
MSLNSLDANTPDEPLLGVLPVIGPYHYAVQYDYNEEQKLWLADGGPNFEKFVQSNRVLLYLERVYSRWFDRWGTDPAGSDPTRNNLDEKQRKIELFSLYIMGLKHRWIDAGTPPSGWTNTKVVGCCCAQLPLSIAGSLLGTCSDESTPRLKTENGASFAPQTFVDTKVIVDLSKVFGPGLPQTALQNYAIGSQDVENMEYRKYEERWEEYHGQPWNTIRRSLSDIEKGPEDVSDYEGGRYSSCTSKVPAIDLAAAEKKRPAKVQPMLRAYKKLRRELDAQPAPAGKEKEVPVSTIVKALTGPPPAPPGQDKEVQVRAQASVALAAPAATQVPTVTTQDVGIQTIAAGNTLRAISDPRDRSNAA